MILEKHQFDLFQIKCSNCGKIQPKSIRSWCVECESLFSPGYEILSIKTRVETSEFYCYYCNEIKRFALKSPKGKQVCPDCVTPVLFIDIKNNQIKKVRKQQQ